MKFMTLTLFAYVATAFLVNIPWKTALSQTVWPSVVLNSDYMMMVVAVLGTTISPYLFFWQASQEVEDMNQDHHKVPLRETTDTYDEELKRIRIDTSIGMIFSNIIAFFNISTTAAVLHGNGITNVTSAAQAAEALRPLAGSFTFTIFA